MPAGRSTGRDPLTIPSPILYPLMESSTAFCAWISDMSPCDAAIVALKDSYSIHITTIHYPLRPLIQIEDSFKEGSLERFERAPL